MSLNKIVESNTMLDFTKVYVSNTVTSLETCHEDSSQQESFAAVENLLVNPLDVSFLTNHLNSFVSGSNG